MPTFQVSKEKASSLGIEFIPLKIALKETVESLKEKKFVSFWVLVVTLKACKSIYDGE